jgi:3-(3-hydroxy-phenyl)propionate hydroxylase
VPDRDADRGGSGFVPRYDLVVVGCGPVGALCAALSAHAGLRTLVVDRAPEIYDLPRAVHFDAQIMRLFQQVGIADELRTLVRPWHRSVFTGADGDVLRIHEFPIEEVEGWPPHVLFYQPELETLLRTAAQRFGAEIRLSTEFRSLRQDPDGVDVSLAAACGEQVTVRADWLIGCDGASSSVRKHVDVALEDMQFDEPWLVVDAVVEDQTGLPRESRMVCDPRRPSTLIEGRGAHRRWEFMLLPGEDPTDVATDPNVRNLIAEWIDPDRVDIVRAAVYRFHGLVANRWRVGRVFLAGDAAHQTPPFLGQGMCHGLRDVSNVVWKLSAVQSGHAVDALLDTYEAERKPHVEQIISMAVASGRDICVLDPDAAAERDRRVRELARRNTLPPSPFVGMPPLTAGLLDVGAGAGHLFAQPTVDTQHGPARLDDLLGTEIAVVLTAGALAAADPTTTEELADRRVGLVVVQSDANTPIEVSSATVVIDREQVIERWLDRYGAVGAVIRPDRYAFATLASADEIIGAVDRYRRRTQTAEEAWA